MLLIRLMMVSYERRGGPRQLIEMNEKLGGVEVRGWVRHPAEGAALVESPNDLEVLHDIGR